MDEALGGMCWGFKAVKFRGNAKYQSRFPQVDPTRLISLATRIVADVSLPVQ
jgi:hypothetical protein